MLGNDLDPELGLDAGRDMDPNLVLANGLDRLAQVNVVAVDLDPLFAGRDLEDLTVRTYDGLGLNVRAVLDHSDLYPRDGKSQTDPTLKSLQNKNSILDTAKAICGAAPKRNAGHS